MASYAGIDLGIVERWTTTAAPKELQVNAYPGVDGLEVLDMGSRGGESRVWGVMYAPSVAELGAVKRAMVALQNAGGAAVFVDPEGYGWPDVLLRMFSPVPGRFVLAGGLGIAQRYEMELLHID